MRCIVCSTPAHLATGWVLQKKPLVVLCGACARNLAKWYKDRMCRQNHDKGLGCFNEAVERSIR
jgi:hypothetical protein